MALVINTNVPSLNSQRQLNQSSMETSQAMERLSSGKQINSAKDDAAGLVISNRMTSQIKGLDRAIANANDGVSLIQTAEGAMEETTNIMQRMRELSIQSANGIYNDGDRATLNAEVQQLKAEVDRIAETTSFNGQTLLDGSLGQVDLQVGAEANQTISLNIATLDTKNLGGAAGGDVVGSEVANGLADLTDVDQAAAATTLSINGQAVGDLSAATTVEEALATINSNVSGVEASAFVEQVATADGDGLVRGTNEVILTLNKQDGTTNVLEIRETGSLQEFVDKVNSVGGDDLQASINDDGRVVFSSSTSASIGVTETGAGTALSATGIATGTTQQFQLSFEATDSSIENVDIAIGATLDVGDLGLNVRTDSDINGIANTGAAAIAEGDLIINGVEISAVDGLGGSATGQAADLVTEINKTSAEHGVVASNTAGVLTLNSVDGTEISIDFKEGGAATLASTGLVETNNASSIGNSVSDIDISTAKGAQDAIDVIDVALEQIGANRADLGAINNRLDFTVSNLSNVSEKTSSARSSIVDADFAKETANLSRAQVLQQASQAMLAQANAAPQQVLSLLR